MECLEKPIWNRYTREGLEKLKVKAPDKEIRKNVLSNFDHVAKPIDGLGRFEALTAQIGAIQGTEIIDISQKPFVGAVKVARINIAITLGNKLVHTMSAHTTLFCGIP